MATSWSLEQTTNLAGTVVRWARFGEGPPLVLTHGTPFSSAVWRDVIPPLAQRHTVYVWDMPGYGASMGSGSAAVSIAAQTDVFAALLESWQVERPHLVAHDIGGAVTLRALLLKGVEASSLVLLDAVVLSPWGTELLTLVRDNEQVFTALPQPYYEALLRTYLSSASMRGLRPESLQLFMVPWLGATGQRRFFHQMAQLSADDTVGIEAVLPQLSCPALICWGEDDQWLPVEQARRLAARIADSRLEVFAGAGHLLQEDAPERLIHTITDFLQAT
jgi:pimeloyl-ACP methyl ester carboxylesterase